MLKHAALATLALLALPACDDDDDDDAQVFSSALGGTSASRAQFEVAPDGSSVAVSMTPSTSTGSAEIRSGAASTGGPVLFEISSFPSVLDADDLQAQGDIDTFEEALDLLRQGGTFVVVRSDDFAGGESRGQIGPATFRSTLGNGTSSGSAFFILDPTQTRIDFSMDTSSLGSAPTSAGLMTTGGGSTFFNLPNTSFLGTSSGTLRSDNLLAQPSAGILTFDDALQALMRGQAVLNVNSVTAPGGGFTGAVQPAPAGSASFTTPTPAGSPPTGTPLPSGSPTTPTGTPLPSGVAPPPVPTTPASPAVPSGFAPSPVFTPGFTPEPAFPGVTPPSSTPPTAIPQPSSTPATPSESPLVPRPAPLPPNTFSPATQTP